MDAVAPSADRDAFLEELIVRRELAVNYVHHCSTYDSYDGFRLGPARRSANIATTNVRLSTVGRNSRRPRRTTNTGMQLSGR